MMIAVYIVVGLVGLAVGVVAGYLIRRNLAAGKLAGAEREAEKLLRDAKREAETIVKEARLEAKEEVHKVRSEVEAELRDRRQEVGKAEQRLVQRDEQLDSRAAEQDRREQSLRDRDANSQRVADELQIAHDEALIQLERISGLSAAQAKDMLLKQTEDEARHEMAKLVRQVEEEARREADRRARNILALTIQRTAANHVAETTVSVVNLPSDDMKGRIIGREGRNIRTLENTTGIDFIIDDTPEAVVLSGFDGVRRETARLTLTKLITDGRIHPARIEETYLQAKAEVEAAMEEAGNRPASTPTCTAWRPNSSESSGASNTAPATARTCSTTPSRSPISPASWPLSWAPTSRSPSAPVCCTTSARPWTTRWTARTPTSRSSSARSTASRRACATPSRRTTRTSSRRLSRPSLCRPPTPSPRRGPAPAASRSRTTSSGSSRWSASPRARRAWRNASPCRRATRCA